MTDDSTTNVDEISNELAYILAPVIASTMGTKQAWAVKQRLSDNDRNYDGMFNDNYYGVLHGARTVGVPAFILEHSFHTNTRITNWLLDENNLDKLAKAEAEAIADGFKFPEYGADGIWGDECEGVAEIAIVKNRGKYDYRYRNLTKLVQKAVGLIGDDIDGMCYDQTEKYIIAYQKAHNLGPDGCVGINTWKAILGV